MTGFTVKRVPVPLCAAVLVGLLFSSSAHALVSKAVGETSIASASCAAGCSLSLRLKKGDTVVKSDIVSGVPWTWLDTWCTGTFTLECQCGDSGWHTIETYNVVNYNLPIVSLIESEDSPISVWLPENFVESRPNLTVWTYPYPGDYCNPWVWTNATLQVPNGYSLNYSEANLSSNLGTRLVNVTAYQNGQKYAYGERQVTMAKQLTASGLGGDPGAWNPNDLLKPVCQIATQDLAHHFDFSTTVTTAVTETEIGQRTFSVNCTEGDNVPSQIGASASCGVYHVQPDPWAELLQSLEAQVGFHVEGDRTLTNQCTLSVDVPANSQLTVFVGPVGQERSGPYLYYEDADINGAVESSSEGTYDAVKITGVHLQSTIASTLP